MNFGKFEKDVIGVFQERIKSIDDLTEIEKQRYSFDLNYVLRKILNSYYFENMYKVDLIKFKVNDSSLHCLTTNAGDYTGLKKLGGVFFDDFSKHELKNRIISSSEKISELALDIIEDLENKDPTYGMLFENSHLKQSLYLKMKHSVSFIMIKNDVQKDISEILVEKHKFLGKFFSDKDIELELRNYGFEKLKVDILRKSKYVFIGTNESEICGITAVSENPITGLNFISYIDVATPFKEENLEKRMFMDVIKNIEKENELIEFSRYTLLGNKKVIDLAENVKDNDVVIDIHTSSSFNLIHSEINSLGLRRDDRIELIKKIAIQIKNNEIDIESLNYTDLRLFLEVNVNKMQNDFNKQEANLNENNESKVKKILGNIFR